MRPLRVAVVIPFLVFASLPLLAHHPFGSTFDWKQPTSLSGVVTSMDWTAPHVRIHLQVFEYWGPPDNYVLELGSPSALERFGWKKASVIVGDEIRVDGWLAHTGERLISVRTVTTVDGRQYFGASSFYDGYGVCVSGDYCGDDEEGYWEGEVDPVEAYCLPPD
jgi:hypothetical protein